MIRKKYKKQMKEVKVMMGKMRGNRGKNKKIDKG